MRYKGACKHVGLTKDCRVAGKGFVPALCVRTATAHAVTGTAVPGAALAAAHGLGSKPVSLRGRHVPADCHIG